MPWVSKEQIEQARAIGLLEYLQTQEPHELVRKNDREYRTVTHGSLVLWHGYWYWNRGCIGGESALDYLVEVRGMGFVDAVLQLCDTRYTVKHKLRPPASQPYTPPKPFLLPPRNRDSFRVISYLIDRGISRSVIDRCIEQGILYENVKYHNAVFVGRDEHGKAKFAALRGTYGNFKMDVAGSNKRYGFHLPATLKTSGSIAVFEAPVDVLSHATIYPDKDCHRLSLGGTSPLALVEFLEHHPQTRYVELCLDNDDAGRNAAGKIAERLYSDERYTGIRIVLDFPPPGMDYNEKLTHLTKREQEGRRKAAFSL